MYLARMILQSGKGLREYLMRIQYGDLLALARLRTDVTQAAVHVNLALHVPWRVSCVVTVPFMRMFRWLVPGRPDFVNHEKLQSLSISAFEVLELNFQFTLCGIPICLFAFIWLVMFGQQARIQKD